jgi:nucleotide-binding universal stress UspA family protein
LSLNRDDGLSCTYRPAEGEAFLGILQTARETQADLIVIGPHRRQLLQDIFIGTTAERIIRNSDIPVLMANGAPAGQYRKVMLATDLTPASADVARQVQRLLTPHLHASEIMYAIPAPAQSQMRRAMLDEAAVGDYVADEEDAAREGLAKFMREAEVLNAKPVLRVNETKAAYTILAAATASNIDLLAIGARSRTGLEKLLLGSTAESILASAQIDILTMPPG